MSARTYVGCRRSTSLALLLVLTALLACAREAGAKPLSEQDLAKLIELQIGDEAIVAKLEKEGAAFSADAEVVKRLKAAGASDTVLGAVEKSAKGKPAERLTTDAATGGAAA